MKTLALFLSLVPALCGAQSTTRQVLYWVRYQNQLHFSPALFLNNEVDNRRFIGPDVQNQLIVHSRFHVKRNRWDLAGGISVSAAYSQYPERTVRHPTLELRPVAEASYEHGSRTLFHHRLRIDNRFFEQDRFDGLLQDYTYVPRARYRLQFRFPLLKTGETTRLTCRVAEEIMANLRGNFFDQHRFYLTNELVLNRHVSLEAGYVYIYQQRYGTQDFFHRHVMRFSLIHRILFF